MTRNRIAMTACALCVDGRDVAACLVPSMTLVISRSDQCVQRRPMLASRALARNPAQYPWEGDVSSRTSESRHRSRWVRHFSVLLAAVVGLACGSQPVPLTAQAGTTFVLMVPNDFMAGFGRTVPNRSSRISREASSSSTRSTRTILTTRIRRSIGSPFATSRRWEQRVPRKRRCPRRGLRRTRTTSSLKVRIRRSGKDRSSRSSTSRRPYPRPRANFRRGCRWCTGRSGRRGGFGRAAGGRGRATHSL